MPVTAFVALSTFARIFYIMLELTVGVALTRVISTLWYTHQFSDKDMSLASKKPGFIFTCNRDLELYFLEAIIIVFDRPEYLPV